LLTGCVGLEYFNPGDTGEWTGPGPGPDNSDTGSPDPDPVYNNPNIDSFSVKETDSKVRMDFVISDQDQDMEGGHLELAIGNRELRYEFPDEVSRNGGQTFLLFEKSEFTPEQQVKCTLTAVDLRGLSSATASALFTLTSYSLQVPEVGDTAADIYALGAINPPVTLEGSIWGAGNLGGLYNADLDFMSFTLPTSKTYTLTLTWTPTSADYDLHLVESTGTTLAYATSYSQPEVITYGLTANTLYYVAVAAWDGSAGNWSLRIQ